MRHLDNRSLGKCLVSYWFVNLELFHPEQRNFDQNDNFSIPEKKNYVFDIEILRFKVVTFFNLTHACHG
jgi:hypothetical protein